VSWRLAPIHQSVFAFACASVLAVANPICLCTGGANDCFYKLAASSCCFLPCEGFLARRSLSRWLQRRNVPLATLLLTLQVGFYLRVFACNSPFPYEASSVLRVPAGPSSTAVEQRLVSTTAGPLDNSHNRPSHRARFATPRSFCTRVNTLQGEETCSFSKSPPRPYSGSRPTNLHLQHALWKLKIMIASFPQR
jgi:hypothetical protein